MKFSLAITVLLLLSAFIGLSHLLPVNEQLASSEPPPPPVTVHPEDLTAITLHAGLMTTGYSSAPVPQLKCMQGACSQAVSTVQCQNQGLDGERHINWLCQTTDLPEDYSLQVLSVSCEGYPNPDSPDIIAGSCGLEYGIEGGISDAAFWSLIAFTVFLLVITVICCIACIYYSPTYVYPVGGAYGGKK